MTRYVITCDITVFTICRSRSDAEEYILSLVEEYVYEDFFVETNWYGTTSADYIAEKIADLEDANDYRIQYPIMGYEPFQTLTGYLYSTYNDFYITEVEELD